MKKDDLGNRMKTYESVTKTHLIRRSPVIIRLDGKAFHTWTRGLNRPFDLKFHLLMVKTTKFLCENIQNAIFGYTQSDEISILMKDWSKLNTDAWFNNEIQKIISVSSSLATGFFNNKAIKVFNHKPLAFFDSRVFNIPFAEVTNYFIWRQQDATRNSVQMLARSIFSHKQLHKKNNQIIMNMLMERNINWDDLDIWKKRGTCIKKDESWFIDYEIPIFTQDRDYIERLLETEE